MSEEDVGMFGPKLSELMSNAVDDHDKGNNIHSIALLQNSRGFSY